MNKQSLIQLLKDSSNPFDLWNRFADWFFSGKWLQVSGGTLSRTPGGLRLDVDRPATVPRSFEAFVSINTSREYVLTIKGGSIHSGSVNKSCENAYSVVNAKKIAYLELSYDGLSINFDDEVPDPEADVIYLAVATFDPVNGKLTQHIIDDVIQMNFVSGFTPPED